VAAGLIERIARHGVSGERDPREDRLTEILAAVLENPRCAGLAHHLVIGLLDAATAESHTATPGAVLPPRELCELLELLHYLRQEGLMDPTQLTPVHMVALANHKEAQQALNAIFEMAARQTNSETPGEAKNERWWRWPDQGCADMVPGRGPSEHRVGCYWGMFDEAQLILRDGRPGVPCFTAGLTMERGVVGEGWSAPRDSLRSGDFSVLERADTTSPKNDYVWRIAYPEDILAGADVEAQGKALAQWVRDTFDDLHVVLAAAAQG
jgi:hypothetical protein